MVFFVKRKLNITDIENSNYLLIALKWFSIYFVISIGIDVIQQLFGVGLGNPLTTNPIESFFYLTVAPLNEEVIFRIFFLGIPMFVIFSFYRISFIHTLLRPSKTIPFNYRFKKTIMLIIILNSVFFGLSHVIFGGGYEIGKITQASFGGLVLGWLYYRHGLATSIIFHWISNYVLFSYGILSFLLFNFSWNDESNNYLLVFISSAFIILGCILLYRYGIRMIYNYKKSIKKG